MRVPPASKGEEEKAQTRVSAGFRPLRIHVDRFEGAGIRIASMDRRRQRDRMPRVRPIIPRSYRRISRISRNRSSTTIPFDPLSRDRTTCVRTAIAAAAYRQRTARDTRHSRRIGTPCLRRQVRTRLITLFRDCIRSTVFRDTHRFNL